MSEAMLTKYGGNGFGEKRGPDSCRKVVLDVEEITESVMQKVNFNVPKKGNNMDISDRLTPDECFNLNFLLWLPA